VPDGSRGFYGGTNLMRALLQDKEEIEEIEFVD